MSEQVTAYPRRRSVAGISSHTILGIITGVLRYAILLLLAVSFIFPFFWMASSAMKNDDQVFTVPPIWFPNPAYPENFTNAWTLRNYNQYTINTIFKYALPATIGTVLSSSIVAYGFARLKWPGRDVVFALCLATLMIPAQVRLIPLFVIFKEMGWVGTYLPLTVPHFFGNAFFIFLLRQFFMSIPLELSDAARVDGANEFVILARIIMPLAKPALAVVALFTLLNSWNDFFGPLIYVNRESEYTLALGIQQMRAALGQVGSQELAFPYLMAVSTIVTIPILIVFFFAQRSFIEGISLTGLKG
jgi:ABC-type glycerol-3-phosphate transport system permease component